MAKTLYAKLILVLVALLSVIALLYLALTYYSTGMYLKEVNQRLSKDLARNLVAENLLMIHGEINQGALKGVFHNLMVINPGIEVYLLDPDGKILAFSAEPGRVKRERVALGAVHTFLGGADNFPIMGDDPRDLGRKKIFSAYPIREEGSERAQGYLYIILGGEEYDTVAGLFKSSYIVRLSTWAVGGLLLFGLAAGLVIFNLLTKRLRGLALEMDAFKESGFVIADEGPDAPGPRRDGAGPPGGDEIDRLAGTFGEMRGRIAGLVTKLKETDNLRRELVANVSHDLRTPLASMQGYIETLQMKEGRLSDEEKRRYLDTVARHAERLGRLVTELFELSKLNSRETLPECEPFSPAELAQDVCLKFSDAAGKKRVELKAELQNDTPFVNADIGLIERVFENLLDNALRHTPEGGSVTIKLAPVGGSVMITVTDTGPGIPDEEMPYIFERFYRAHAAKEGGGGEGGAGLGLAITKRILELHGSSIEVESKPGQGASFSFTLPSHRA